jgi:hypothetical protein
MHSFGKVVPTTWEVRRWSTRRAPHHLRMRIPDSLSCIQSSKKLCKNPQLGTSCPMDTDTVTSRLHLLLVFRWSQRVRGGVSDTHTSFMFEHWIWPHPCMANIYGVQAALRISISRLPTKFEYYRRGTNVSRKRKGIWYLLISCYCSNREDRTNQSLETRMMIRYFREGEEGKAYSQYCKFSAPSSLRISLSAGFPNIDR